MEKIKVGIAKNKIYDIGLFDSEFNFEVSKDLWNDFVKTRENFEMIYYHMIELARKKLKKNFVKIQ